MNPTDRRLAALEGELQRLHEGRRRTRRLVSFVIVAGALGWVGSSFAANGLCPNGYPVCFTADSPAIASDVNQNFAQVKEWLEAKVGTVGTQTRSAGPAVFDSSVSITGGTTINGGLTANSPLTLNGNVTFNSNATFTSNANFTGNFQRGGYVGTCATGVSGRHFSWCCRGDARTGATSCKVAGNWQGSGWGGAFSVFPAASNGNYTLHAMSGIDAVTFPGICRLETNSGTMDCRMFSDWGFAANFAAGNAF